MPGQKGSPLALPQRSRRTTRSNWSPCPVDEAWAFDHWEGDILETTEAEVGLYTDSLKIVRAVFVPAPRPDTLQARFTASAMSGVDPLHVSFEDDSIGAPTTFQWDFNNDGIIYSTERDPNFTYETPGTHTVRFSIEADALEDDKVPVDSAPVCQRTIAPAAFPSQVLPNFVVRYLLDLDCLDNAERVVVAVGDHAEVSLLGNRCPFGFVYPLYAAARSLRAIEDKRRDFASVLWDYSEIVGVDVRGRPVRIDWQRLDALILVTVNVGGQSVLLVVRSDNSEL